MTDDRIRRALGSAGRELAAMKRRIAGLVDARTTIDREVDELEARAQRLTVRMHYVREAWRRARDR